jgi:hypothetical protein
MLHISEAMFVGLLGAALAVTGVQLMFQPSSPSARQLRAVSVLPALAGGGGLGLLAGVTAVGGVYLAPLLHWLRWGAPREIAGAASLFILVNSRAGLAGQTT